MLSLGVIALGVNDVDRAAQFWSAALGYERRHDGFGGWATVLIPQMAEAHRLPCRPARRHRDIAHACI